jgi:hypothetical protein
MKPRYLKLSRPSASVSLIPKEIVGSFRDIAVFFRHPGRK